ncbi:hypothetical protein GOBAR_AA13305 [Gossypium barbadense]|uniref:Uncharacterized protein n=1 Tax=Gossypium barbadense TaxID=3634 RepID=A0A2P5XVG0_GOSBA|nr:hypothetical protein GOBAR_AA13305 [Gossypium barbadense]
MSLRLMADGEGNEVGKVSQGWGKGRCLRTVRIIGGRGRDETTKAELDRSKIINICHDDLKMEGRAKFHCELEVCQLDDLKEEPPLFSRQESSNRLSHLNLFKCGPVNAAAQT